MALSQEERRRRNKIAKKKYLASDKGKAMTRQSVSEQRRRIRDKIGAIKEASPCSDCGRYFPAVCMDFDHVQGEKIETVSQMHARRRTWAKIQAEIDKCELVCANCHRLRSEHRLERIDYETNAS